MHHRLSIWQHKKSSKNEPGCRLRRVFLVVDRTKKILSIFVCLIFVQIRFAPSLHAAEQAIPFYISRQNAGEGLPLFGQQADVSVVYQFDLVKNHQINGLQGEYSLSEAVDLLLEDSGLEARFEGSRHLIIILIESNNKGSQAMNIKDNNQPFKKKLLASLVASAAACACNNTLAQEQPKIEEVVVTGIKGSLARAVTIKRNAMTIQDSIAAEDLGKFPDQNVAESLQRVPGVTISRVNGEGSKITVRGFGPQFNVVKVNNRTLATTEAGRAFDFQILPSELISGADVIKAPSANISAGSIGAFVNIKTARPLDNPGFHAAGSIDARNSSLSGKTDPKYSAVFSNTFADDTIGVLLGVSHADLSSRIDVQENGFTLSVSRSLPGLLRGDITNVDGDVVDIDTFIRPGRVRYFSEFESRERTGVNATVQFAPNDQWVSTADFMYTDFSRFASGKGYQLPTQSQSYKDVVVDDERTLVSATLYDTNVDVMTRERIEGSETTAFGLNNSFLADGYSLEFDLAYSKAESKPEHNEFIGHITRVDENGVQLSQQMVDDGDITQAEYDALRRDVVMDQSQDVSQFNTTLDFADPTSVRSHWNDVRHTLIDDEILELAFDGDFDFEFGAIKSIEAGISYLDREKSSNLYRRPTSGCTGCNGQFPIPEGLWVRSDIDDFLKDIPGEFERTIPTIPDREAYLDYLTEARQDLGDTTDFTYVELREADSYTNREETTSIYGQLNLERELGDFTLYGNAGLRYVSTDTAVSGSTVFLESADYDADNSTPTELRILLNFSELTPVTVENSDSNLLPSLNLNLDLHNGFIVRAAASKTITRPAIEDIGVNRSIGINPAGATENRGNPNLKPYEATQYDLSLEYYADNGNAYSVAYFNKNINVFIEQATYVVPFDSSIVVDPEITARTNQDPRTLLTLKDNRPGGSVSGLELSALHAFDYLPGFWSGFGVQGNYTFATSVDDNAVPIEIDYVSSPGSAVEGFARNSFNLIGFYEQDNFQARLAYNWRDTFLSARRGSATAGLPEHTDEYGQVDLSMAYDINENFTVTAEAINLTNSQRLEFADIRNRVTLIEYTGPRYQLGIRATF